MNSDQAATVDSLAETLPRRRRRSRMPRFGLRTLFVVAILFCLVLGWIGKRYYQVRQDEAAIEALKRAGADDLSWGPVRTPAFGPSEWNSQGEWERFRLAIGLSERSDIESIGLWIDQPDDPRLKPALAAIGRFPEIRRFIFKGGAFDDQAMTALKDRSTPYTLLLYETSVTGEGLASLGEEANLDTLHITVEGSPGDLFAGLATLKRVRVVGYSASVPIDRSDVAELASLPKLESLFLTDWRPSGEPGLLMPLERTKSLKHLSYSAYGDAGADEEFPCIPSLEQLELYGMTDEALAKWPPSPALRRAELNQPITADGARAFSAANPACDVTRFGGESHFGPRASRYLGGEAVE